MNATIKVGQKVRVSINPVKEDGSPARIDGDAVFTSYNPAIATIEPIDANSAYVVAVSDGDVIVVVDADADLDADEVRGLRASGMLTVVNAEEEATSLSITFGEPETA